MKLTRLSQQSRVEHCQKTYAAERNVSFGLPLNVTAKHIRSRVAFKNTAIARTLDFQSKQKIPLRPAAILTRLKQVRMTMTHTTTHTHTLTHKQTHKHTQRHTDTHRHTQTHMHAHVCTHARTHTHTHTHTPANTHQ